MALPADGVPVSCGRLHVVAVTISRGPLLPRLAAGLHQLLGRHCIEMKPLSSASVWEESHDGSAGRGHCNICHHQITSVTQEI